MSETGATSRTEHSRSTEISAESTPRTDAEPTHTAQPIGAADDGAAAADEDTAWEAPRGSYFRRLFRTMPAWLVSMVLHMAILIALALYTFSDEIQESGVFVSAAQAEPEQEIIEEISEIEIEEIEELEEVQDFSIQSMEIDPGAMNFGDLGVVAEVAADAGVGELALADTTIDEIGSLFGTDGAGMADVGDGLKAAANFFGAKTTGSRFIFVVDNSNSMGRGRFETALAEMVRTVDSMGPRQQFYVIFFSDTAYRLFHPRAAPRLVPATDSNKEKLKAWLYSVEMCLQTRGVEAMKLAISLNPEVIYILGDGAFTDKTEQLLTAPHNRPIAIHTLGMEIKPGDRGEKQLTAIAKANRGTYRAVRASPVAQMMAKKNPIRKNRTRGPVWGLKLPPK